jgi:hypothetical protein
MSASGGLGGRRRERGRHRRIAADDDPSLRCRRAHSGGPGSPGGRSSTPRPRRSSRPASSMSTPCSCAACAAMTKAAPRAPQPAMGLRLRTAGYGAAVMVVAVRAVPWWGVISSAAAPVLLIGGWTVAAGLQPRSFNPVADTISALAAEDAADRWVMTFALLGLGACYVMTALALRRGPGLGVSSSRWAARPPFSSRRTPSLPGAARCRIRSGQQPPS